MSIPITVVIKSAPTIVIVSGESAVKMSSVVLESCANQSPGSEIKLNIFFLGNPANDALDEKKYEFDRQNN